MCVYRFVKKITGKLTLPEQGRSLVPPIWFECKEIPRLSSRLVVLEF